MELRRSPPPERPPSPWVSSAEAGQILVEEKAKDKAERAEFVVPETWPTANLEETPIASSDPRPLHDSFLKLDDDRKRKLGSLKAEVNDMGTEEYLATGRGEDVIKAERDTHQERYDQHTAMMKRGEEIRLARQANESLLGRFKNSLANMNKRIFGRPPVRETKPGNESSAERPE